MRRDGRVERGAVERPSVLATGCLYEGGEVGFGDVQAGQPDDSRLTFGHLHTQRDEKIGVY